MMDPEPELSDLSLNSDYTLIIDISDALSEREKVKYTIHSKINEPEFSKYESSVVREHEEFIWLHYCLESNENYAGFIVPPAPPQPNFSILREKLQKLCKEKSLMSKEDFKKYKQELEHEYLATFKITVKMHEIFLSRLAVHPKFRHNTYFKSFLENSDLSEQVRNKKKFINSFFKRISFTADEVLLSRQKDVDNFFENKKCYLHQFHNYLKEATIKSEKVCLSKKNVSSCYSNIAVSLNKMMNFEKFYNEEDFYYFLSEVYDTFERLKFVEKCTASNQELKETETLRYFTRELQAAKELLYRRLRCLSNFENAEKNLYRAKFRNRNIKKAELEFVQARDKFENFGVLAKNELEDLTSRQIDSFQKNFTDLAELEIKNSKSKILILQSALDVLKEMPIDSFLTANDESLLADLENDNYISISSDKLIFCDTTI